MLKYLAVTIVLGLGQVANAQNATPVTSKVKSAIIYLNKAELHNAAQVSLKPGSNVLIFKNITPFLDPASVRVSTDKDVTITGVNLRSNFLDDADLPEAYKTLSNKLKDAELNLKIRQTYKSVYLQEKDLIIQNKQILGGDSKLTPEDLIELANLYRNRLKEVEIKILEIGQEEADLTKEVEKLKLQMGDRNGTMVTNRTEVEVTVSSKLGGLVNFDLSYLTDNAGWSPAYEVRTDDNTSGVKLIYKANVFQNTGLDWNDVKLTLSTGNPGASGQQPELYPDYVDYQQMGYRGGRSEDGMVRSKMMEANKPAMGMSSQVDVKQGQVNVYFEIAIPYQIASSNRITAVDIQENNVSSEFQYLSIPKLSRDVYLVAALKNWEGNNLLAGPANVYYNNSFIGQSFIDPLRTNGKLEVALGNDKGVSVDRKDLNQLNKDAGILGSNKKSFHYKFTVKNNKSKTISIRIEDQLPIARNTDIAVEPENFTGGQLDEKTGVITWNLSLQPGEQREFELKYTIKFPKGSSIDH